MSCFTLLVVFQQWDGKNWGGAGGHLECKGQYPLGMSPPWKAAGIEAFGRRGCSPVNIASFRWATFATCHGLGSKISSLFEEYAHKEPKMRREGKTGHIDLCPGQKNPLQRKQTVEALIYDNVKLFSRSQRAALLTVLHQRMRLYWPTNPHPAENRERKKKHLTEDKEQWYKIKQQQIYISRKVTLNLGRVVPDVLCLIVVKKGFFSLFFY